MVFNRLLVRNFVDVTWPCCRKGILRHPANGSAVASPTPDLSGPNAIGPAGRVLGSARYYFASSTSKRSQWKSMKNSI